MLFSNYYNHLILCSTCIFLVCIVFLIEIHLNALEKLRKLLDNLQETEKVPLLRTYYWLLYLSVIGANSWKDKQERKIQIIYFCLILFRHFVTWLLGVLF